MKPVAAVSAALSAALAFTFILPLLLSAPARAGDVPLIERMHALAPQLRSGRGAKGFPLLQDEDLAKVEAGKVVLREYDVPGQSVPRTVLAKILPYPAEALYLVVADLEGQPKWVPGLSFAKVVGQEQGGLVLHGYELMEAPTTDRFWVTRCVNNKPLFNATQGQYWEIYWSLMGEEMEAYRWPAIQGDAARRAKLKALSDDALDGAVPPKFSDGAWVLVPLGPSRTYMEYDSFSDPDLSMVERAGAWAFGSGVMKGMFEDLAPFAKAYAEKKATPPAWLVDMDGAPAAGLLQRMP